MILVLVSALVLGAGIPLSKLDMNTIHDMKPRLFLVAMFFLLVVAKFGLLLGIQAKRYQRDQAKHRETLTGSNGEARSS
jgi:hypothetical protein